MGGVQPSDLNTWGKDEGGEGLPRQSARAERGQQQQNQAEPSFFELVGFSPLVLLSHFHTQKTGSCMK